MRFESLVLATLIALACASAAAVSVTDDRGRAVAFDQPPARIVSLLPSLTETVCELGACDRLVGVDRYSNWPARVNSLPKLGGLEDAQLERIVSLKPDLVLAATSARVIGRLEALGIKVLALEPRSQGDTRRVLEAVAQAIGRPGAGNALWQTIDARIAAAARRVPAAQRGRSVYFEVAAAPYAAGESSFVGETLARLGLVNIVPAALGPFPKLNPEFIVRARPQIVMAASDNFATMARRPGWGALPALRVAHPCSFPATHYELMTRPGPRMGEAAEIIADCLVSLEVSRP
ncbi:MAG: helical backbone metal receptor [Burkholderiaceae bacterium]